MIDVNEPDERPPAERAVLFDVGGTLASNGPVASIAARLLGLPTTGPQVDALAEAVMARREEYDRTGDDTAYWQQVSDDAGGPELSAEVVEQLVAADVQRWARLTPAVLTLLRDLDRAGVRMGVLSNAPTALARTFDNQPWSELISVQRFSCFTQLSKPHRRAYEDAVEHLDVPAGRVIFLDDRQVNVDAAVAAGLDAHLWEGADDARELLERRGLIAPD